MNPIVKPWPFRGWGINLIGQIYPLSSKNHKFMLVAIDYFTKWVEAIPLRNMMSKDMVEFVKEHIIYIGLVFLKLLQLIKGLCSLMGNSKSLLPAWELNC